MAAAILGRHIGILASHSENSWVWDRK